MCSGGNLKKHKMRQLNNVYITSTGALFTLVCDIWAGKYQAIARRQFKRSKHGTILYILNQIKKCFPILEHVAYAFKWKKT